MGLDINRFRRETIKSLALSAFAIFFAFVLLPRAIVFLIESFNHGL